MAKVTYSVNVVVEVDDTNPELIKVAGREIISGINSSLDQNQNVEDIIVTGINASISLNVDCMPDEELNAIGA